MTEQEAKETNKKVVCEIKIDAGMMRKIIDEKIGQIELDVQEIRNKAIDDVLAILNEYNVPFNADVNFKILDMKKGE